ncbi:MAG: 16S rRNA (cytosine(1402)-N(4))-methyltransferase RsmH [Myxococcota bacterium]|nr:16S rRNA (cytosine(1402)-N(4))-methyltransferase RsmH [Myxococcota bacterium]
MTGPAHISVLASEVIDGLAVRDHGTYVDGTLGRAGHAALILEANATVTLVGIDRDPTALESAHARLAPHAGRTRLIHGQFADIAEVLGGTKADGIVLDLGVSSPQLDVAERGFSFGKTGPLDMRMDPTRGPTAFELMRDTDADTLADVIRDLGEERHAKKIARMIKEAIRDEQLATTTDLANLVARAIPAAEQRKSKINPATRTFQALRIAVNAELEQLERFLDVFPDLLAPGGRCAVISFHSLEDRLVKQRFRDLAWTSSLPPKLAAQAGERVEAVCELISRKAIVATDEEIARNPRSRSARLRICERTTAPNVRSGAPPTGSR